MLVKMMCLNDPNCHFEFDPWIYVEEYYGTINAWQKVPLKRLHDFYRSNFGKGAQLKVLNFGCGPIVAFEASAVPYASEIVLAEYTEQNREVAKLWLEGSPSAPDFTAFYKYVVEELEGGGPEEVAQRQAALRVLAAKGLISCDIFRDPPLQQGFEGPTFDVVYTASCLEVACSSIVEYTAAVSKLADLVKPGGWLVMNVSMGEDGTVNRCHVGPTKFVELNISPETMRQVLEACRFMPEAITVIPQEHGDGADLTSNMKAACIEDMMFVIARKAFL